MLTRVIIFTAVGSALVHLGPICYQGQSSQTRPRSQGLDVLSHRLPLSRRLRDGLRLLLRFQPGSGPLLFGCAQENIAHTPTNIFWLNVSSLYCCLSLSLGLGGVVERKKVPSKKDLGRKKGAHLTSFFFFEKVVVLPSASPSSSEVSTWPERELLCANCPKGGTMLPSVRPAGCSHVLISCNHMYPAGSLSLHFFLISQIHFFRIQANTYIIIIKLFTI